MKVLLNQREEDKLELEKKVLNNVKDLVLPYVDKLKTTFADSGAQLDTYVLHAFKWLHKFDKIARSAENGQIQ